MMPKLTRLCDELGISFEHCRRLRQKAIGAFHRCHNESADGWDNYGGRGIRVLFSDVRSFVVYLITLPGWDDLTLTLDRIENNGHYAPGNLRFATTSISIQNRRLSSYTKHYRPLDKTNREWVKLHYPELRRARLAKDLSMADFIAMTRLTGSVMTYVSGIELHGKTFGVGEQRLQKILDAYKTMGCSIPSQPTQIGKVT